MVDIWAREGGEKEIKAKEGESQRRVEATRRRSALPFRPPTLNGFENLVELTDIGFVDPRKVHDLNRVGSFSQTSLEVGERAQLLASFGESTSTA